MTKLISLSAQKALDGPAIQDLSTLCKSRAFHVRKERVMFLTMADRLLLPSSLLSLHIIGTSISIITYHRLHHLSMHA